MKQYRIDNELTEPDWWLEEDRLNKSNEKNRVWVEQIVKIFGETHYTERYSLMSRNKLKELKLWKSQKPRNPLLPQNPNTQINFTSVV
jgi:hypothetical protein